MFSRSVACFTRFVIAKLKGFGPFTGDTDRLFGADEFSDAGAAGCCVSCLSFLKDAIIRLNGLGFFAGVCSGFVGAPPCAACLNMLIGDWGTGLGETRGLLKYFPSELSN